MYKCKTIYGEEFWETAVYGVILTQQTPSKIFRTALIRDHDGFPRFFATRKDAREWIREYAPTKNGLWKESVKIVRITFDADFLYLPDHNSPYSVVVR